MDDADRFQVGAAAFVREHTEIEVVGYANDARSVVAGFFVSDIGTLGSSEKLLRRLHHCHRRIAAACGCVQPVGFDGGKTFEGK